MSKFYGSFLDDDKKNEHYNSRVLSLITIAEQCVNEIVITFPNLEEVIHISYQNIYVAMGRYFNDVDHYKKRHNITLTHTSKIIAHTIKWVSIYPAVFCSATYDKWEFFTEEERIILLNVNYIFIKHIVQHFIDPINPNISESIYENIYDNLTYYLKTGNYNERMASLWFEQIIKG